MLMCNHKIRINTILFLLNSAVVKLRFQTLRTIVQFEYSNGRRGCESRGVRRCVNRGCETGRVSRGCETGGVRRVCENGGVNQGSETGDVRRGGGGGGW